MDHKIKGEFLVDYVRMIKSRKDIDWSKYFTVDDLLFLKNRIVGTEWYPMEPFERMATAIFKEIGQGKVETVRWWGRLQAEEVSGTYDSLVSKGNPHDSLIQFKVLRKTFFNFDPINVKELARNFAQLEMNFHMNPVAEEASAYQTLGILERLVELSGAINIQDRFLSKAWKGAQSTVLELSWSNVTPEMKVKGGLFVDYVRMLKKKRGLTGANIFCRATFPTWSNRFCLQNGIPLKSSSAWAWRYCARSLRETWRLCWPLARLRWMKWPEPFPTWSARTALAIP